MFQPSRPIVTTFLLSAILVALPLSIKITNILTLTLLGILVVTTTRQQYKQLIAVKGLVKEIGFLALLFAVTLLTLIYSDHFYTGWKNLERYIPLLILPLIFALAQPNKNYAYFMRVFSGSIVIIAIVCLAVAVFYLMFIPVDQHPLVGDNHNQVLSKWNVFSNTSLMHPVKLNPIFMSMFVCFAMFIILEDKLLKAPLKIVLVIFLLVFQMLLGSRIGILALAATSLAYLLLKSKTYRVVKYLFFTLPIALIAIASLLYFNPILKKRYLDDFNSFILPDREEGWNGVNIRYAIWKCSFDVSMKSPVWGYGVGSQYEVREKCYANYTFYGPFGTNLDSHNQYFEFMLIGGILLLSCFILQLIRSIRKALSAKSVLHLVFVILVAVTCGGESMLEKNKGIVFFAYFNSLFLIGTLKQKEGPNALPR